MTTIKIIAIIIFTSLIEFITIWLWGYFTISDYTNLGEDVIWVSKNYAFNWFFTYFFPAHAIMYEDLCERLNSNGLALLLLLLTLITFPLSILMGIIGGIVCAIRAGWQIFCRVFARKE